VSELFVRSAAWPVLLAVLPFALGLWLLDRRREARRRALLGPRAAALGAELSARERCARRWLASAALGLGLLTWMQPRWGWEPARDEARGIDLLLCLDVSRSMLARDLAPDRLSVARRAIRELAEVARGDRLGLVAFAGEARLVVPPTSDATTFVELAELVDPDSVQLGGTDLGAALERALAALTERPLGPAAIVLLTDGEDLSGKGLAAAEACAARGVPVHAVGIGTALGSKIVVEQDGGESFLVDADGQTVVSALDPASLERIARATGGRYLSAETHARPLVELYGAAIAGLERVASAQAPGRARRNRYRWPLALFVLLGWLQLASSERRRA